MNLNTNGKAKGKLTAMLMCLIMVASSLAGLIPAGATAPLIEVANITGGSDNDLLGWNVSYAGDVNDDGINDTIVGAPGGDKAYVFFGGSELSGDLSSTDADVTLTGNADSDFGWSVSSAGNVDGAGGDDVIVGAPGEDKAYIFLAATISGGGNFAVGSADVNLSGTSGEQFGSAVAGLGDVNNANNDDIIIGAYLNDTTGTDAGAAYVFFGTSSLTGSVSTYVADVNLTGRDAGDWFGFSVAGAGNVNNDDYDDIIVGAPKSTNGNSYVFYGSSYLGKPHVLVIDDDGANWGFGGLAQSFSENLTAMGFLITEQMSDSGYMALDDAEYTWLAYDFIVWVVGDSYIPINRYNTNIADNLVDYVQMGGRLFIEGGSLGYAANTRDWTEFMDEVLNIETASRLVSYQNLVITNTTHPVTTTPNTLPNPINLTFLFNTDANELGMDSDAGEYNDALATLEDDGGDALIVHDFDDDPNNGGQIVFLGVKVLRFSLWTDISDYIENGASWLFRSAKTGACRANITFQGQNSGDLFGWSVSTAGDVDANGKDDVIIGAPGFDSDTGKAYIIYSGANSITNNTQAEFETGTLTGIYAINNNTINLTESSSSIIFKEDFEDDDGPNPDNPPWDVPIEDTNTNIEISTTESHYGSKSLMFDDDNPADMDGCAIILDEFTAVTSGVLEFWLYLEDQGDSKVTFAFILRSGGKNAIEVGVLDGAIAHRTGTSVASHYDYIPSQWHHYKVIFDTDSDTFDFYMDGKVMGNNLGFATAVSNIDNIEISTFPWDVYGTNDGIPLVYVDDIKLYQTISYNSPGNFNSTINSTQHDIAYIVPTWVDEPYSQTLTHHISRDGGMTWSDALDKDIPYQFNRDPEGSQLRYKAEFATGNTDVSPIVDSFTMTYTMWTCLRGGNVGDQFGYSVSYGGDMNNDTKPDVIVGAPYNDTADGSMANAGAVYVYNGSATMVNYIEAADADYIIYGANAGDQLGRAVSEGLDIIDDGNDELVAGAPYQGATDAGTAYLYSVVYVDLEAVKIDIVSSFGVGNSEWIELYNAHSKDVDLTGWILKDQDGATLVLPSATMSTGTTLRIYTGTGTNTSTVIYWQGASDLDIWDDDGDDILLLNLDEETVDYMAYEGAGVSKDVDTVPADGDWTANGDGTNSNVPAPGEGNHVYRYRSGTDSDAASDWFLYDPLVKLMAATGGNSNDLMGWNASYIGDLNSDGFADTVIGAPGNNSNTGTVYIIYGSSSTEDIIPGVADVTLTGASADDLFGWDLDSSGDWNGDGTNDVLVGAPGAGKAYVFYGGASMPSESVAGADATFTGLTADKFGHSVAFAGDVNGADNDDVIVGSPEANSAAGFISVFHSDGNTDADKTLTASSTAGDRFGHTLSRAGDVNGDGDDDILIGAPGAAKVCLYYGGSGMGVIEETATTGANPTFIDSYGEIVSGSYTDTQSFVDSGVGQVLDETTLSPVDTYTYQTGYEDLTNSTQSGYVNPTTWAANKDADDGSSYDIGEESTGSGVSTNTETRYMRDDTTTVNTVPAYQLGTSQTDTGDYFMYDNKNPIYWGIRVFLVNSNGDEYDITQGTTVAIVSRTPDGEGLENATWNCPEIALNSTDAIIVRVYYGYYDWSVPNLAGSTPNSGNNAEFITGPLDAQTLDSNTWTVYYYLKRVGASPSDHHYFHWGDASAGFDSRIQGFKYSTGTLDNYNMNTNIEIDNNPDAETYTLEYEYYTTADEDFDLTIWDGSIWNQPDTVGDLTQEGSLSSLQQETLDADQVIGGTNKVSVQVSGLSESTDTINDTVYFDFVRVHSYRPTKYNLEAIYEFDFTTAPLGNFEVHIRAKYVDSGGEDVSILVYDFDTDLTYEDPSSGAQTITQGDTLAWYNFTLPNDYVDNDGLVRIKYLSDSFVGDTTKGTLTIDYHAGNVSDEGPPDVTFTGGAGSNFGWAANASGNLNGDGYDDIIIGEPDNSKAHVFFGGGSLASTIASTSADIILNGTSGDNFGWSVGAAIMFSDANIDLLVGAPKNDHVGIDAGAVFVFNYTGSETTFSSREAERSYLGEAAGDMMGYSLTFADDINNDGFDDLLAGAPYLDGSVDSGRVYFLTGRVASGAPGAPQNLALSKEGSDPRDIRLEWSAPAVNPGSVNQYNVYRSASRWGFDFDTTLTTTSNTYYVDADTSNDVNPNNATSWYYIVRAEDSSNDEDLNWNVRGVHRIELNIGWNFISWTALETVDITSAFSEMEAFDGTNPDTFDYDKLIRWNPAIQDWENYLTNDVPGSDFTQLSPGYGYAVNLNSSLTWVYSEGSGTGPTLTTNTTVSIPKPTNLGVNNSAIEPDTIDLTWDDVGTGTEVSNYYIFRATSRWGFDFTQAYAIIADTDSGSGYAWSDTNAPDLASSGYNATTYCYVVRSVNSDGKEENNVAASCQHRQNFRVGWNYISWDRGDSVPITSALHKFTPFNGTSGDYDLIERWDNVNQDGMEKYYTFKPIPCGAITLFCDDFTTFEPGYGYAINIRPEADLTVLAYSE